MLESDYQIAKSISYVINFVSFVAAVLLVPFIQKQLAGRFEGLMLIAITYLVAFLLMVFVFPRIILMVVNR